MPLLLTCMLLLPFLTSLPIISVTAQQKSYLAVAISTDGDAYGFGRSDRVPQEAQGLAVRDCTRKTPDPTFNHCTPSLLSSPDKCIVVYRATTGSESEIDFVPATARTDASKEMNWVCGLLRADKCTLIEVQCIP
jgi:hypothetical protein